jgi:hypothetical protein
MFMVKENAKQETTTKQVASIAFDTEGGGDMLLLIIS